MKHLSTETMHKSGIYKITNQVTGEYYLGSSVNLYFRACQHISKLKKKTHSNRRLQNSYNKYGPESFTIEVIQFTEPTVVRQVEYDLIEKEKPAFNLINDFREYYFDEEVRQRMSEAQKALQRTGPNNHESKPVECYDMDGNYVETFESISAALKALGKSGVAGPGQIGKCLKKERPTAYGYQWKYSQDPSRVLPLSFRGKLNALDGRKKIYLEDGTEFTNSSDLVQYINTKVVELHKGGSTEICLKICVPEVPVKPCELLETPEMDNQQPS